MAHDAAAQRLDDFLFDRMSDDARERFWSAPQDRFGGKTGREAFEDYGPAVLLETLQAEPADENTAELFA